MLLVKQKLQSYSKQRMTAAQQRYQIPRRQAFLEIISRRRFHVTANVSQEEQLGFEVSDTSVDIWIHPWTKANLYGSDCGENKEN